MSSAKWRQFCPRGDELISKWIWMAWCHLSDQPLFWCIYSSLGHNEWSHYRLQTSKFDYRNTLPKFQYFWWSLRDTNMIQRNFEGKISGFWHEFSGTDSIYFSEHVYEIDPSHKSHDAPVPYPTMHLFVMEGAHMCTSPLCNGNVHTCAHFLESGALWDNCLVHFGICEMGLLSHTDESLISYLFNPVSEIRVLVKFSTSIFGHCRSSLFSWKETNQFNTMNPEQKVC